jgi:hypothetical protein
VQAAGGFAGTQLHGAGATWRRRRKLGGSPLRRAEGSPLSLRPRLRPDESLREGSSPEDGTRYAAR